MSQPLHVAASSGRRAHEAILLCSLADDPRTPGGDDILLPWAGKDITEAMKDEDEHVHSKSAYMMMEEVRRQPSASAWLSPPS